MQKYRQEIFILKILNKMTITNQIFEHYRIKQRKIEAAKKLLLLNGYRVSKIEIDEKNNYDRKYKVH